MSDEKPRKPRSGAPGGDRPMRRKSAAPAQGARAPAGARKPAYAKSASDAPRADKPHFDKPRAAPRKEAAPVAESAAPSREKAFEGERIAKVMARAGACSRRDAEAWIAEGRIAVNGRVLDSPAFNVKDGDRITIDGEPMVERERTRLFLFHKPSGLVTSARDPEGRETVFAYLAEHHPDLPRVVSVGRLDITTEGLLLLTNDGGLARTLELPATGWTRRYRVRAHGETDQAILDGLKKGVTVDDVRYAPIDARLDRVQGANAWLTMGLTEGKNREVKRVLEHLQLDVTRLIRISYGPFQLGDLTEGAVEEVKLRVLREQLGKELAALAGVDFSSPLHEPTPAEAQQQREHVQKRSRKHVSLLRDERDEKSAKGPRAKIERGATADRKGRAVEVERVVARSPKRGGDSRNARRFEAIRREGDAPSKARAFAPGGPRAARRDEAGATPNREYRGAYGARDERRPARGAEAPQREERSGSRDRDARPAAAGQRNERPNRRFDETGAAPRARAPRDQASDQRRGPLRERSAPRRNEGDRTSAAGERKPFRRSDDAARAPRGEGRPQSRQDGPSPRRSERSDGPGRSESRAPRPPSGERAARPRFERDDQRSGERSPRAPGGKPRSPRAGAEGKSEAPRRFDGERDAGGPRKAGGKFGASGKPGFRSGGAGKPGSRPSGGGSRPGAGPRKPGGPGKPRA